MVFILEGSPHLQVKLAISPFECSDTSCRLTFFFNTVLGGFFQICCISGPWISEHVSLMFFSVTFVHHFRNLPSGCSHRWRQLLVNRLDSETGTCRHAMTGVKRPCNKLAEVLGQCIYDIYDSNRFDASVSSVSSVSSVMLPNSYPCEHRDMGWHGEVLIWIALTWPAGLKSGLPAVPLATGRTENADCKQVDPKEAQHTCHLIQTDLAGTVCSWC